MCYIMFVVARFTWRINLRMLRPSDWYPRLCTCVVRSNSSSPIWLSEHPVTMNIQVINDSTFSVTNTFLQKDIINSWQVVYISIHHNTLVELNWQLYQVPSHISQFRSTHSMFLDLFPDSFLHTVRYHDVSQSISNLISAWACFSKI